MENSLACYVCNKIYKLQFILNRHLREVHKINVLPGGKLKCPLCKTFTVNRHASLRAHLAETHKIKCERRNIKFTCYEVFKRWKSSEEKHTLFCYTMKTSVKAVAGNAERLYLHCHRSGHYQPKSTGERRLKSQGSNRIDSTCPSMMVVTREASGQIKVNYWKTHVGHVADIEHTVVPKRERMARIRGKHAGAIQTIAEADIKHEVSSFPADMLPLLFRNDGSDEESPDFIVQIMNDTKDMTLQDARQGVRRRSFNDLDDVKLTVLKVTEDGEERIELSTLDPCVTKPHVEAPDCSELVGGRILIAAEKLFDVAGQVGDVSEEVGGEVLRLINEAISLLVKREVP